MLRFYSFVFSIFLCTFAVAEDLKPAAWVPLPAVGSSPETGLQYGAYIMRIFPQTAVGLPQDRLELLLQGTANGQYQAYLWPNLYFQNGTLNLRAKLGGKVWPSNYFGESNTSDSEVSDSYANTTLEADTTLLYAISDQIQLGGKLTLQQMTIESLDATPTLLTDQVQGYEGGRYVGVGAVAIWDNRDNLDWPTTGQTLTYEMVTYVPAIGSDLGFTLIMGKSTTLIPVGSNVLALSGNVGWASDETPFTHLFKPSGNSTLRGANGEQWIGYRSIGLQGEYRVTLSPRWATVGFLDTFQVADSFSDVALDQFHYSIGAGIRFAMTPDRFNIRLDVGYVDASTFNFAISVGEAF